MKRNTWQREAVRDALGSTEGFVTAQALHASMRGTGPQVGLRDGVPRARSISPRRAKRISLQQEGESLYRACTPGSHHHHLICRTAAAPIEVLADPVESWARRSPRRTGFTAPEHVVDVFRAVPGVHCEALAISRRQRAAIRG